MYSFGCSNCIIACPYKALSPKVALFDLLLAEGASAVVKAVKKSYYINVIKDISLHCDCWSGDNEIIAKDVGVLFGSDIVAIDKASLDLVVDSEGEDVFKTRHHKSPIEHIKAAESLGMGKAQYKIAQ